MKKFNPNSDFQVSCSSIADGHSLDESFNANEIDIMLGERYGIMLHATMPYTGFISIDYKSMNTDSIWQTESVPLNIILIKVEETNSEQRSLFIPIQFTIGFRGQENFIQLCRSFINVNVDC